MSSRKKIFDILYEMMTQSCESQICDSLMELKPYVHCLNEALKGILCDFCFNEYNF
jgi:hypothetical protein